MDFKLSAVSIASFQPGIPFLPPYSLQDKEATATENFTARSRSKPLLRARAKAASASCKTGRDLRVRSIFLGLWIPNKKNVIKINLTLIECLCPI
jgi:hypothetical protein